MPNHVHLLIETPEPDLAEGMQRLQSMYAQAFNATYGRSGHLFQGRFGAVRIRTEAQLATVLDYIDMNPPEAGLCRDAGEWPWSSRGAAPQWVESSVVSGALRVPA
jgi:REP element-mobilizing transposase RayT